MVLTLVFGTLLFTFALWALQTGRASRLIEQQLKTQLYEACQVELRIPALQIEPFGTRVHVAGLELVSSEGRRLLAVEQAWGDLSTRALLQGRIEISELILDRPYAEIRVQDGDLIDLPSCARRSGAGGGSTPLGLDELSMTRGRFRIGFESAGMALDGVFVDLWPDPRGGAFTSLTVASGKVTTQSSTASGLNFDTLANVIPIQGFGAAGHIEGAALAPRSIRLDRFQIGLGGIGLDAAGAFDFIEQALDVHLFFKSDLARIPAVVPAWPQLTGVAELDLRIRSRGSALGLDAEVSLYEVSIGNRNLGREVHFDASGDQRGVDIHELRVALDRGGAVARGRIENQPGFPITLEADARSFSFAALMDAIGNKDFWVDFAVTGPTSVKGKLLPLELIGPFEFAIPDLTVWDGAWDDSTVTNDPGRVLLDVVPIDIAGRWRFTAEDFEVLDAELRTDRSRGRARALVHHQGEQRLSVDAELGYLDFDDLGPIAGVSLLGAGPVSGRMDGRFAELSARGAVNLDGVSIAGIPLGRASAEVRWNGANRLTVGAIEGQIADTSWHGDLDIDFSGAVPVHLKGEIGAGQLGDLLLPLGFDPEQAASVRGNVRGRFEMNGPVARWSGPLELQLENVIAFGQPLGSGRATGLMDRGRFVVKALDLQKGLARSTARGWIQPGSTEMSLNARFARWHWSDLTLAQPVPTLSGDLGARVRLEGRLLQPRGEIVVDLEGTVAGPLILGEGRLGLQLDEGRGVLDGRLDKAGIRLTGTLDGPLERLPFRVRLVLDDTPLPVWIGAELGTEVKGAASADMALQGDLLNPLATSGEIRLGDIRFQTLGRAFVLEAKRPLRLSEGVLELNPVVLTARDLQVELRNEAGLDGQVDLDVVGSVGVPFLAQLIPFLERPSGALRFQGKVLQKGRGWEIGGEAQIDNAAFEWPGVPSRFSELTGRLTFSESSFFIDAMSARWAGGWLRGEGSAALVDLIPSGLDVSIDVERVRPRLALPYLDLSGQLDGRVALGGTWPTLTAKGRVDVTEGRVRPRTDLSELVGLRSLAAAYDPSAEVLELDIGVGLEQAVRVRNDDVDVTLQGELQVTGTNERIGMLGSLSLLRGGRVSFLGRSYLTEGGLIELRERYVVSPRYDLSVSTIACDARISLNLVGDLSDVLTSYASNPEMDDEDITSCLIRGIKRQDLDRDLASFAGSALLKLSGVDRQVKRVIPIDQLDVTTEFSSRARAYEPRVWVAKDLYLLDRPVRLEYSTSLLRNDDQRAAFRVNLTPRLSLQLGWTSSEDVPTGDWGLDLENRWEW